jgi:tetratricopeptide (TPR) repeat protein
LAFQLVSVYLVTKDSQKALELVDQLVARPNADASTLFSAATVYAQLNTATKLESTLQKLVALVPGNPEAWYDLAAVQATLRKTNEALKSAERALALSDQRLPKEPKAQNLRTTIASDARFHALRQLPGFPK